MPRMIPDIDPRTIPNNGERLFYSAAAGLPDDYTVCYSFKYAGRPAGTGDWNVSAAGAAAETAAGHGGAEHSAADREGEADFVIVHPALGYVVVEVKQGEAHYANGLWHEFKDKRWVPLSKDPIEQARKAMYAIRDRFREVARPQTAKRTTERRTAGPHAPSQWFPLQIKFAICFPECTKITGYFPAVIDPNGVLCFGDLEHLEDKIVALFGGCHEHQHRVETDLLVDRVLAPTFKVFARLDDQIEIFHSTSAKVLTEEQERILAETELDKRKVFLGAAGTGKTFLAMEKARRLERGGGRVFLTCFNKNLARYVRTQVPSTIVCCNFHDYLIQALRDNGQDIQVPDEGYWTAHGDVFDYGTITSGAIGRIRRGSPVGQAGATDEGSNGNGSLMRILPHVLYFGNAPVAQMLYAVHRASAITHAHPISLVACGIYALIVRNMVAGAEPVPAYKDACEAARPAYEGTEMNHHLRSFDRFLSGTLHLLPEAEIRSGGFVVETLEAAVWSFLTTGSYEEAVLRAVNLGEDTDSTGAVAGGLAGVCYGTAGIPCEWLEVLARRGDIEALAERFADQVTDIWSNR